MPTAVSAIQQVTVFPDRARVTRVSQLTLSTGLQQIEFDNLPLALLPDSVRASGKGVARAKLLGVTTECRHYRETPAEAVRALEAQIQAGEDADADQAAHASVLEKEQKYLEGLAMQSEVYARGLALRDRTPAEQGAIFDFVRTRLNALQADSLQITRERRERAKELDRLRRELKELQSAQPKQRYLATVELDVSAAGEFELELTYVVTGAGWKPLYDLRWLDPNLEVTYLAQVAQNTGEDWPNVALTLSTARPSLSLEVPELKPWYIQPMVAPQPATPKAKMAFRSVAPAPMQASAGGVPLAEFAKESREEAFMDVETATVSEAGASLTYQLAARADIPGNNDPRKVTVATFSLKPNLDYVTAPKLEQVCYRRATVKNESLYSLLAGQVQLFAADEYLGVTYLEFVAPGQEFELVLGGDERLRVERELAARDVDKTIIGDRRRIRYAYTIEIENLRDTPQTIIVCDQIPVSRDEQIKVKLEAAEPKPTEISDLNVLEWKLTLGKAAKQTIRFEFSAEYPRTLTVTGLP